MNKDAFLDYLSKINERIQSFPSIDTHKGENFSELIWADFVPTIENDMYAKKFYHDRLFYFEGLVEDQEYNNSENVLIEFISKFAGYLNNEKFIPYIIEKNGEKGRHAFHKLPDYENYILWSDFFKLVFDQASYSHLRDHIVEFPSRKVVSRDGPCIVLKQWKRVNHFLCDLFAISKEKFFSKDNALVLELLRAFDSKIANLSYYLLEHPTELHCKSYQELYYIYAENNPVSSLSHHYRLPFFSDPFKSNGRFIDKCKRYVAIIIEDLKLHLQTQDFFLDRSHKISRKGRNVDFNKTFNRNTDSVLDENIVLRMPKNGKAWLLLHKESRGKFLIAYSLRPLEARFLRYLYTIVSHDVFKTRTELSGALFCTNDSLSNAKSNLNGFCSDEKVKPLIVDAPQGGWQLNSDLTCFDSMRSSKGSSMI